MSTPQTHSHPSQATMKDALEKAGVQVQEPETSKSGVSVTARKTNRSILNNGSQVCLPTHTALYKTLNDAMSLLSTFKDFIQETPQEELQATFRTTSNGSQITVEAELFHRARVIKGTLHEALKLFVKEKKEMETPASE